MPAAFMLLCCLALSPDRIELRGGSFLDGEVLEQGPGGVLLRLAGGETIYLSPHDVASVHVGDEPPSIRFLQFVEGEDRDALQTAIAIYLHPETLRRVSLIGAVHVADPAYFDSLQKALDTQGVVLFEGVGGGESDDAETSMQDKLAFVGKLQLELGNLLDLSFQKDAIDYTRPNFRHADLTFSELSRELTERKQQLLPMQNVLQFLAPVLTWALRAETKLLESTGQKQSYAAELKRRTARMLVDAPRWMERIGLHDAEKRDDVIVSVRNEAAFRVLDAELATGEGSIAIFYGAAHLPDMNRLLVSRGFAHRATLWLDAWSIPKN